MNTGLRSGLSVALEAANRELEAFNYSVSHDYLARSTPTYVGFVQLLLKGLKDRSDEKTRRYAATILEASNKMGKLIDNLLDFSRLGRKEMQKREVNLNTLVSGVIQEIQDETLTGILNGRSINFQKCLVTVTVKTYDGQSCLQCSQVHRHSFPGRNQDSMQR